MARSCFVIQPFDGADYDRRYREIFLEAIKRSGFEPYRIDEDSSASIPIVEIEKKIEQADVWFADITSDNPNVWCEVGLAIAHRKDLCLVCGKGRKLPFDVQHRQVIFYATNSPSDFTALSTAIENRLLALAEKQSDLSLLPETIASAEEAQSELSSFEVAVIGVLASELSLQDEHISIHSLRQSVDKQGYTSIAANAGVRLLVKKQFVSHTTATDFDGNRFDVLSLTGAGWDWIHKNIARFKLKKESRAAVVSSRMKSILDDDIPF